MKLSVVIPTRNRANLLEKFLLSAIKQTLSQQKYEILIIDNGSSDNTAEVVKQYTDQLSNLYYYFEPNPGLHSGRHRGYLESKGEILIYGDDDIEAFPTWLETIEQSFQNHPEVVMVGGKNLPNFESTPPEWLLQMWKPNQNERILGYLSILDLGDQPKFISPYYIFGCNFAIRRSILKEAGGFHPDGMPQELIKYRGDGESYVSAYVQKQGYKAMYEPNASVYHWVSNKRMTLEYFCQRAYSQGISDSYTKIRESFEQSKGITKKDLLSFLIERLRKIYRIVRNIVKETKNTIIDSNNADIESKRIQKRITSAYQEGFNFHQKVVKEEPELLKWVLRSNYWNYELPNYKNS